MNSTRVSNELGAGHAEAARLAVWVAVIMIITEAIVVGLVLVLIRNIWGYAYSYELEVVKYVASMMPILAASHFLEGLQCVLSGSFLTSLHRIKVLKPFFFGLSMIKEIEDKS